MTVDVGGVARTSVLLVDVSAGDGWDGGVAGDGGVGAGDGARKFNLLGFVV